MGFAAEIDLDEVDREFEAAVTRFRRDDPPPPRADRTTASAPAMPSPAMLVAASVGVAGAAACVFGGVDAVRAVVGLLTPGHPEVAFDGTSAGAWLCGGTAALCLAVWLRRAAGQWSSTDGDSSGA